MTEKPTYEELEKKVKDLEKKRAPFIHQQNLPENESQFSQLFQWAPIPMAYATEKDGYGGTIWNAAWYRTFGYPEKMAQGRSGQEIGLWVHSKDRSRLLEMATQTNYVTDFDTILRCYDGSLRHCTLFGRFIENPGNRLLMVIYHDVTDRKQAEEKSRQNERITHTLYSISNAINTTENLDHLYRSIYQSLNNLINLPNFFIAIVDPEKKLLNFPFFIDEHDTKETIAKGLEKYKESTSNTSQVIRTKRPMVLTRDQLQERLRHKKTVGTVADIWIGIPLIVRDKVIGVMVTQHYSDPEYFTPNDLSLLISVSDQVALAIDRKRSQEQIRQREKMTQTLFSISNAVNTTLNLRELYQKIHSLLGEIFDVTNFFIALIDNHRNILHFPYFEDTVDDYYDSIENFNPEGSLTGLVISKRKPILLTKEELMALSDRQSIQGTPSLIWMGAPLMIKDEVIGIIAVQSYTDPHLYNTKDLEILSAISDQVAIAIDRKRTEDNLRRSEKKYRYLFNNSPVGMYEIDFIKPAFIEVNEVLCRYSGYTEAELLNLNPLDLLTENSKKQFINDYEDAANGVNISNNIEYDILTKDRQELCVLLNSDFIYDDGRLKGARVVVHDITERKKMEAMIIQSEKMMSIGGLAAGMAHEINNPLAGIMQNAQVIKNRLTTPLPANDQAAVASETTMASIAQYMEKRKILSSLDNIINAGSHAAKIVDNMLSFARKGDSSKTRCDMTQLLNKTLELAQSDYSLKKRYDFKQIHIKKEFNPGIPDVPCEESKIMQVLFNIIKNAAESMHEIKEKTGHPSLIFRLLKVNKMIQIEIEDNGPGMSEALKKRVFEPFFTTKEIKKGTGLGLSLSYFIIVEEHQGEMAVESAVGKGSKFIIRLPLS